MSEFDIPWQTLVDTAPAGLFVLDADGVVQYANAPALTLLDLSAPGGAHVGDWLIALGDLSSRSLLQTIEKQGQLRLYLPDAEWKHLLFEAESLPGANGILCRIRRDHQVEASEIIAMTAHELRKPMTLIMGYAKMMLTIGAETLSDMQRQFLDTINRNVQRLNSDLLAVDDMTRVDQGRINLDRVSLRPADIIELALQKLQPLVDEKGHTVDLNLKDLPSVHADPQRFEQILHILLDNTFKYTPAGGEINVRGHVSDGQLQIDVVDNGLGISIAEQKKIFSKFFRGEDERICEEHPGLGLNLYIARGLAEFQGGRLWFESTAGQGSTFSFTLPLFLEKTEI